MPRAREGVRASAFAAVAVGLLCSCSEKLSSPYPNWRAHGDLDAAGSESAGFSAYRDCSQQAERLAGDALYRVHFTPGMRARLIERLAGPLNRLESIGPGAAGFEFEPGPPFETPECVAGWRLLGRAMVWRIEHAVRTRDYDAAVRTALAATRLGFSLSGGGAIEADLGMTVIDEARRAIVPALRLLDPAQLERFGDGLEKALRSRPPLNAMLRNERMRMLEAVQLVQDCYRTDRYDALLTYLPDCKNAVHYLRQMKREADDARPAYFQGFAAEAEEWCKTFERHANLSVEQRRRDPGPSLSHERPWKRFAKHFFLTPQPILCKRDASLARTRLLSLECRVLAAIRRSGAAPDNLSGFDRTLTLDPFSGGPLIYRADGEEYRLYSVGADLRDNGGETGEGWESPDLLLEYEAP